MIDMLINMRGERARRRVLGTICLAGATAAAALFITGGGAADSAGPAPQAAGRCAQPGPYQLPHGAAHVDLDAADFAPHITNRYWPMRPGTRWTYRETEGSELHRVTVTVLHWTRMVHGIRARVVHDVVRIHGRRWRTPTTGTPRTRAAASGTSGRGRGRSAPTGRPAPRAPRGTAWTAPSPA
jgi:hypothetical protein